MDIKDIYNGFEEPTFYNSDLTLNDIIGSYFRACPLHRNDTKIGYIVLSEKEYKHLWDNDEIKLTNVDIPMTHGYPNLYQHISRLQTPSTSRSHQASCWAQTTRLTSTGRETTSHRNPYLVAITIMADEPRTRNILRPYSRDSSQHQEFELNQPTSTPPLHAPSTGNVLVILRGPTSQYIYDKVDHPGIVSSHVFDQTAISGPLNSHDHSLISLCAHDTIWSKAYRHIQMYFLHMMNIIKWQEETTSSTSRTIRSGPGKPNQRKVSS